MKIGGKNKIPALHEEDLHLFQVEVEDVTPLSPHGRILPSTPQLSPIPLSLQRDEREVIFESLHDHLHWSEYTEADKDTSYVRSGINRQVLRRLRRGEWHTQAELDLHGLTKIEAKHELAEFLFECKRRGIRCVRIVHGKGLRSPNREPVLKLHVRHWLMLRDEVLAYVEARPADGGSGAVVALLKSQ